MKRVKYFFKSYKTDFITAVFAALTAAATFRYAQDPRSKFWLSVIILSTSLLVIIYTRFRERDFVFSALTWRSDKESWLGYGLFELSRAQTAYVITNSEPGIIYGKCLAWSDYLFEFDFKIANVCLGIIVRAVNLANYVMLQINTDTNGIRPHIRVAGGWKWWEAKESKLELESPLSLDQWYKCQVVCDKNIITIRLFDGSKMLFDRIWEIPQGMLVFSFKKNAEDKQSVDIPFPITLEYGSVGFRNAGAEKVFVKNVLIQKL